MADFKALLRDVFVATGECIKNRMEVPFVNFIEVIVIICNFFRFSYFFQRLSIFFDWRNQSGNFLVIPVFLRESFRTLEYGRKEDQLPNFDF